MNLKQLEAFQLVMQLGSTTAAAEQLGLSQSAISRLLMQLESSLGLPLFVRTKGRLVSTPEATALLRDAQGLMEAAQGLHRHAEQLRRGGLSRQLLKIAVPSTLATQVLPSWSRTFLHSHPQAVLEVLALTYQDAEQALLSREADLALVRLPMARDTLQVHGQLDTLTVCVMPQDHPLATQALITPQDLIDMPLVLLGRQGRLRHELDMAFRLARVPPKVTAEVHSVEVACRFVEHGMGVTLVNNMLAQCCRGPNLVAKPFRPELRTPLGIVSLKQPQPSPLALACALQLHATLLSAATAAQDWTLMT